MLDYVRRLNETLIPNDSLKITVLDLFAGCGGLALGFESVGFSTVGFEKDHDAAQTYASNLEGHCLETKLNTDSEYPPAQVIIGGPPCQPFSVSGNQQGIRDERNGFPAFLEAVRKVNPEFFLFENVRGMLYGNKWYFEEIILSLESLGYTAEYKLLNAANYGVPQNRERLFVAGHRGRFAFPQPEPQQITVAEAIGDLMEMISSESKFLTASMDEYVKKYEIASKCIRPRDLYPDKPARTLTCRNLAASTGDMQRILLKDGRRRRLLIREAARLQSFPDWFTFSGNETSQFYQIGNAVPPMLARHLAESVRNYFVSGRKGESQSTDLPLHKLHKQLSLF